MIDRNALREQLERIGEADTGFGRIALDLAVLLDADPAKAEIDVHNRPLNELSGIYAVAGRGGRHFAPLAKLCERVLLRNTQSAPVRRFLAKHGQ